MILKDLLVEINKNTPCAQVVILDPDGNQIICNFVLLNSIIHPSMFWTDAHPATLSNILDYTDYGLTVRGVINRLNSYPVKSKIGYKGQEVDYAEPEDRHIILSSNMKSIYCGKFKYLTPDKVEYLDYTNKVFIYCKELEE